MCQLQTDHHVSNRSDCAVVFLDQRFTKPGQIVDGMWANCELIRIRASLVANCNCLTAPNQFCTTRAKVSPTAKRRFRWPSIDSPVPTFHWVNGKSVAECDIASAQRLCEW